MSVKPYKINDRRGQNRVYSVGNNALYKSARQTADTKTVPNTSFDFHRNVTRIGHRQLANVGEFIYANFAPVRGALLEQAELSVGHFIPQFTGRNKEWGKLAERKLTEWHRIMDYQGWPNDSTSYLTNLILTCRRRGDHFTLLTETDEGYPFVQVIGAHRIDCRQNETEVKDGDFKGYSIVAGNILDDYGRLVGYRIYDDGVETSFQDVSAADGFLLGFSEYAQQYRYLSGVAACAFDWQNVEERRKFELLAQKLGSSIALIEKNEAGEAPGGADHITLPEEGDTVSATPSGLVVETYDGGTIRYLKPTEAIETLKMDRPSADSQRFEDAIIRGAFKGMEWDVDFSLDPSKVGGASMRVVVEKINATIRKNQRLAAKAMRRIDGWAISKFIKLGMLPHDPDWFMFEYQGPGQVTADRKYDSDVDLQEIAQGVGTRRKASAKRGSYWEDDDEQREREADSDLTRAKRLADKHKISIQEALVVLRPPTPNGNLPQPPQEPAVDTPAKV